MALTQGYLVKPQGPPTNNKQLMVDMGAPITVINGETPSNDKVPTEKAVVDYVGLSKRVDVPTTPTSAGEPGEYAFDGVYVYRCIATNTWVRHLAERSWVYGPITLLIQTDMVTGGETTFTLPSTETAILNIDWGDGNEEELVGPTTVNPSHTYASAGQYEVQVYGLDSLNFYNTPDESEKVLELRSWNTSDLSLFVAMFYNCSNMVGAFSGVLPDTHKVLYFSYAFAGCTNFNSDLDGLDVSNGIYFNHMFYQSGFNQPIPSWDTSNARDTSYMFREITDFNQPLNHFDVSNVTNMCGMMAKTSFNQPLPDWDVSSVEDMGALFWQSDFNQDINTWDVSNVTTFYLTFAGCPFNQPLNDWDVSNGPRLGWMFYGSSAFNQPLNDWDVSKVTDFGAMFRGAQAFNQDISSWDMSSAENLSSMFSQGAFNSNINAWDTSNVTDMQSMFQQNTVFNQPLNNWDTSNVTTMQRMFQKAEAFNQPLDNWDTSNVTNMAMMFDADNVTTSFNQDISNWDISSVTNMSYMLRNIPMSSENYSKWLISCANQVHAGTANTGVPLHAYGVQYNSTTYSGIKSGHFDNAVDARNYLTTAAPGGGGWTIVDGGTV